MKVSSLTNLLQTTASTLDTREAAAKSAGTCTATPEVTAVDMLTAAKAPAAIASTTRNALKVLYACTGRKLLVITYSVTAQLSTVTLM